MRIALAAVASLAFSACATTVASTTVPETAPLPGLPELGTVGTGTVAAVLDGDSLRLVVDGEELEVRLLGINAPERDECGGERARDDLTGLLADEPVSLSYDERDRFGRVLGYLDVDGRDAAVAQLEAGNAIALSLEHPRDTSYFGAERAAMAAAAGVWGDPGRACGDTSTAPVAIAGVDFDPPGRDQDGQGEAVAIGNDGAAVVDMTGWALRDESTRWRYDFPAGFALDGGATVTVVTGCGSDDATTLHWCTGEPVWSNEGDTALLLDPGGNIRDHLVYGRKAEG